MRVPKLVGNGKAAAIGIFIFILVLCAVLWRSAHAADTVVLRAGTSVGPGGAGPVLGLDVRFPQGDALDVYAGALLWGQTARSDTNWDWHAGVRSCRWRVCANLGAAYVQKVDALNGSHTNFNLGIAYQFSWWRLAGLGVQHLSNAGTIAPNLGRNAVLLDVRLQ